jgi:hypothetical protein
MKLKIRAGTLFTDKYLEVDSAGVKFCETSFVGGAKRFNFSDIDYILMSDKSELSFQVKQEVFSISVKWNNDKHKNVVTALLKEVRRANIASVV